ncbi:transcriptional regulator, Crp/Fnr family [hydrothermal vent metagenome]|uniref:Transcriptional regulator, Crp/Fnr family n=1 Tax=hydrothermal vent metagenome TaxID=652676 RepID=A0A3B0WJ20_9ZZZZ
MKTATEVKQRMHGLYPDAMNALNTLPESILEANKLARVPQGSHLFREADQCECFMWLIEGTVRVFKNSEEGREITLYRVSPGELCVLSLQSLFTGSGFPAAAVADTNLIGVVMSKADFDLAIDDSKEFRKYLLQNLSQRLSEIVQLISEVTFSRLDLRLACLMGQRFERSNGSPLKITHAELARELGTTREMISRILKEFEHQQCISLARGEIHLVSSEGLSWFSH